MKTCQFTNEERKDEEGQHPSTEPQSGDNKQSKCDQIRFDQFRLAEFRCCGKFNVVLHIKPYDLRGIYKGVVISTKNLKKFRPFGKWER